jgi:hypothetical protein
MTSLVRSHRRGIEKAVIAELELAEAQATIAAGRAAACVRATGQVVRVAMDEMAAINMAEAAYVRFAATDRAAARIELVADHAATRLAVALHGELRV